MNVDKELSDADHYLADIRWYIGMLLDTIEDERDCAIRAEKDAHKWEWIGRHRVDQSYGLSNRKVVERQQWEIDELEAAYRDVH